MKSDSYKTFTYPDDFEEKECDEFINHFINLALHIAIYTLKNSGRYFGLDLAKTAAYEGCFKAYILSKKIENIDYKHCKGFVRTCVKRAFWSFARIFGYIRSRGQVYFPTAWIEYESYFRDRSESSDAVNKIDSKIINEIIKDFPDRESEIHQLFLAGYDYAEIGKKLGYKNKSSPLKMHKRTLERVKKMMMIEI